MHADEQRRPLNSDRNVTGYADDGFGVIADEFSKGFSKRGETGAALAVVLDGRLVVDLWGGTSDARSGARWHSDTLNVIFSCTKGLLAICALNLVAEGRLDLDAPVSTYWPEFAGAGKAQVVVRWLLQHRAGLIALDTDLTVDDLLHWEPVIRAIEAQAPLWKPGTSHQYHTLTYGWLVGELIRRVTGMTAGGYLRSITTDAIAPDTWIGLPVTEEPRVARLAWDDAPRPVPGPEAHSQQQRLVERAATLGGALPVDLVWEDSGFNDPRMHGAEIPGAGGISTARDLARIWSSTTTSTNGVRLLSREITDAASVPVSFGRPVFGSQPPYGAWGTGFAVPTAAKPLLSGASYGHDGVGGQRGFADPDALVGFGYLTNHLVRRDDTRADALVAVLRNLLDT
jgi:CubicO group peptidase (beta-lactamase class C family)